MDAYGITPLPLANRNGFTLIEVMIAIIIFAIGILAVITMQSTSVGGNANARYISEASNSAADRVEQIANAAYTDASLTDTDGNGAAGLDNHQCCPGSKDPWGNAVASCTQIADHCATNGVNYGLYWNVADNQPVSNLKSIRVFVTTPLLQTPVTVNFIKANAL